MQQHKLAFQVAKIAYQSEGDFRKKRRNIRIQDLGADEAKSFLPQLPPPETIYGKEELFKIAGQHQAFKNNTMHKKNLVS